MARLPEEWIHFLLDRLSLQEVVGRYIPLQLKGGKYWACCPFHNEKTPSFSVDPQKGFYYCFGCHKGGNAITFVSEMEKVGFREACERLAEEAGVEMPSEAYSEQSRQMREKRQRICDMNREAALFFAAKLFEPEGAAALEYLRARGLGRKDVRSNGLGYAPDDWHATGRHLLSKGFTKKELVEGGLQKAKNGNTYDVFRGRVVFPIINWSGQVIGFGGRVLDGGEPKYLNSPETPAFDKRRNLYHLNVLRKLGHVDHLLLMEGYMDVVSASHYGVMPTVASLGTALTPEQARMLKRYNVPLYVCYDGDEAGIRAAERACGILRGASLDARVVVFPDGQDPDEFLRARGPDALREALDSAMEPVVFRMWILARGRDLSVPRQKSEYVEKAVRVIREEPSAVRREQYARLLAQQTGYSERAILQDAGAPGGELDTAPRPDHARKRCGGRSDPAKKAENLLAAYILAHPDKFAEVTRQVDLTYFENPANMAIFQAVSDLLAKSVEPTPADVLSALADDAFKAHAAGLVARWDALAGEQEHPEALTRGAAVQLQLRQKREELESEREACRASGADMGSHVRRIQELSAQMRDLRAALAGETLQ